MYIILHISNQGTTIVRPETWPTFEKAMNFAKGIHKTGHTLVIYNVNVVEARPVASIYAEDGRLEVFTETETKLI